MSLLFESGFCYIKRAVRNRSTLKLVLPASLKFLIGWRATRHLSKGKLVVSVSMVYGEVKICRLGRKLNNPVINLGRHSRHFRPGPAKYEYDRGVLTVWQ